MPASPSGIYRFGDLTLDLVRGALRSGESDLPLRPKSFDILTYFVTNAGRLLSKQELMQAAWPGLFVTEDSLVQCVGEIRRAVGEDGRVVIKTVPGRGYIFDIPVTAVSSAGTAATDSEPFLPGARHWRFGKYGRRIAAAVLILLCLCVGGWLSFRLSSPASPRLSIVVLPFANLSGDPDQEYLADGLTDDLTTAISYIEDSFVIARNTAFTFKGKTIDAKGIGRELGVRYLLEGSVQRTPSQIRINAQLIDAETGAQLWAKTFERERGNISAIQDEITMHIARALNLQLVNIEGQRAEREGISEDALDYIMRGDVLIWRGQTKENSLLALAMYEKALQLDEHSPRALASVAIILTLRVLDEFSDAPEDDLRRAEQLAAKALAIDPNYWEVHFIRAQILRARKHYDEAIVEYETANSLNPLAVNSRLHLARAKILIGEPAAAIPILEQVLRISPRDPQIGFMHYRLGLANLLLGNTDEAISWYKKAVLTYFKPADAYLEMGAAFSLKGDKAAAQAALAEAAKLHHERMTIASARKRSLSERSGFVELREQTLIKGLRMAGMPE